jgi:hypothetical protein
VHRHGTDVLAAELLDEPVGAPLRAREDEGEALGGFEVVWGPVVHW